MTKSQTQIGISFTKLAVAFAIIILSVHFVLFYIGYITESVLLIDSVGFTLGIILISLALRERKKANYEPSKLMVRYQISYILVGAIAGMTIGFFVFPLSVLGFSILMPSYRHLIASLSFESLLINGMIVGIVIGSIAGHLLFKRSKYAKITYFDPFA